MTILNVRPMRRVSGISAYAAEEDVVNRGPCVEGGEEVVLQSNMSHGWLGHPR